VATHYFACFGQMEKFVWTVWGTLDALAMKAELSQLAATSLVNSTYSRDRYTAWHCIVETDTQSDTNCLEYRAQANPSSPQYQLNKGTNQCNSVSSGNTRSLPETTNTGGGHTRPHNISYIHLNHYKMSRQGNHVKMASNM